MSGDLSTKTCKIIPFGDHSGFKNALKRKLEGVDFPSQTLSPVTEGKIYYCGRSPSAPGHFRCRPGTEVKGFKSPRSFRKPNGIVLHPLSEKKINYL